MRLKDLRPQVESSDIYKMSLGKSAIYEQEALVRGALVFQSEKLFHDAVMSKDSVAIARAAALVKSEKYPNGKAPPNAWGVWEKNIGTFMELPTHSVVLHWESCHDRLYWGVVASSEVELLREEDTAEGQDGYVFERKLVGGWQSTTMDGVQLSNIHPKARNLAINMATINFVRTDADFFRALILDKSTDTWTSRPDWQTEAKTKGWHQKPTNLLREHNRKNLITPQVEKIVDDFEDDIRRMADTALKTVVYANGQSVITTLKAKDTDMTREELLEEVGHLFREQDHRCKLTHYDFNRPSENKHLFPSLDRIDSTKGYVRDNLQIVTRAANFYKSASDEADWHDKAQALEKMALAIQRCRKSQQSST